MNGDYVIQEKTGKIKIYEREKVEYFDVRYYISNEKITSSMNSLHIVEPQFSHLKAVLSFNAPQ